MSLRMQDVSNTKLVRKLLPFFTKKHPVHGQVATQDASDKTIVGFVHVERREGVFPLELIESDVKKKYFQKTREIFF